MQSPIRFITRVDAVAFDFEVYQRRVDSNAASVLKIVEQLREGTVMTGVHVYKLLALGISLGILSLTAGGCQADALANKVLQTFHSQAPELRATTKSDDELQVTSQRGPLTVYLFNARMGCASNKNHCDDEVSSFVQRVVSFVQSVKPIGASDLSVRPVGMEKVYPVLVKAGFAKAASKTEILSVYPENGAAEIVEEIQPLVVLPFVDSIELVFLVGDGGRIRYVSRDQMVAAGLTEKALLDLTSRNPVRLPPVKYGLFGSIPGLYSFPPDFSEEAILATSRVFDSALWDKLEAAAGCQQRM